MKELPVRPSKMMVNRPLDGFRIDAWFILALSKSSNYLGICVFQMNDFFADIVVALNMVPARLSHFGPPFGMLEQVVQAVGQGATVFFWDQKARVGMAYHFGNVSVASRDHRQSGGLGFQEDGGSTFHIAVGRCQAGNEEQMGVSHFLERF